MTLTRYAGIVAALLLIIPLIPGANADHDPNDFFVTEATFGGVAGWYSVHGTSPTNVWAVGTGGAAAQRTGGGWSLVPTGETTLIGQVHTTSTSVAMAALGGSRDTFILWDGAAWSDIGDAGLLNVVSVWGSSDTSYWVGGRGGGTGPVSGPAVRFWDGAAFSSCGTCNITTGGDDVIAISGSSATDVWALVSADNVFTAGATLNIKVWHYDGVAWSLVFVTPQIVLDSAGGGSEPASSPHNWIHVVSPTVAWFTGGAGTLYEWDGVTWSTVSSPTTLHIHGMDGPAATDAWAVGNGGVVIHRDAAGWAPEPTTTSVRLGDVHCTTSADCWAVGGGGIIQKLQVNPAVATPSLAGLQWDPADMITHTSEAQCLGDNVTLGINFQPSLGAGGFQNYILNSRTGLVVEQIPTTSFFNLGNKHLHASRPYPAGEYTFLVVADTGGLLAPDNWAAETFSVPRNDCGAEIAIEEIINQITETIINEGNITRTNITQVFNVTESEIGISIDAFFWLAVIATAFWLGSRGGNTNPVLRWASIAFFALSAIIGLSTFESVAVQTFAVVVGLAGFLWAASLNTPLSRKG